MQHGCRERSPLVRIGKIVATTGDALCVEQMRPGCCGCADYHLSMLIPQGERTILGGLRIDLKLQMDCGPLPVELVACPIWKDDSSCQRDVSASCQRDVLVNRNRLTWLYLGHNVGCSAGKGYIRERIGWIAAFCYLHQKPCGVTRISCAIVRHSEGAIKPGWPVRVVCE